MALVLAAAVPATAATVPDALSRPRQMGSADPGSLSIAVNGSGTAAAAWTGEGNGGSTTVQVALRRFGGEWIRPEDVGGFLEGPTPVSDVAVNARGDVAIAWSQPRNGPLRVGAAVRPAATGEWQRADAISPASQMAGGPAIALDAAGNATVAWTDLTLSPAFGTILAAVRPAATGAWSAPEAISGAVPGGPVRLQADSSGTVLAQWGTSGNPKRSALRPPGGPWGAPETIGGDASASEYAIVLTDDGTATYAETSTADGANVVRAARRPAGGPWGPFQTIVPLGTARRSLVGAVADPEGRVLAGWGDEDGRRQGSLGGPGAAPFSAPFALFPTTSRFRLAALAAGADGTLSALGYAGIRLRVSRRTGGTASWRPSGIVNGRGPRDGGRPIDQVALGVDARGTAVAAWAAGGLVSAADFAARPPGTVRLTRAQVVINQRIAQSVVRRANAVAARLDGGLEAADIRDGALLGRLFAPESVEVAGDYTGAIVGTTAGRPIVVRAGRPGRPGEVRLARAQLRVNQRIAQAAIRRLNAIDARLRRGLDGRDVRDGALTDAKLAPAFVIVSSRPRPAPTTPRPPARPAGSAGAIAPTREQLAINQRISQAGIRRANALIATFESGIGGDAFAIGGLTQADLAPEAR